MAPAGEDEFQTRAISLDGVEVEVDSYRVGARWAAKVHAPEVGNSLARGGGSTREEAERVALDSARMVLDMRNAAAAFRVSADRMKS